MPGRSLNVPLHKMSQRADCLAACASMVLDCIGHSVAYTDLLYLLEIGPFGTPAQRITQLARWNVDVEYDEGTLERVRAFLDYDQPVIVLVRTHEFPYWRGLDVYHSVVVVGYDKDHIYVNDPYFDDAPKMVAIGDFVLAWQEMSYRYAVISGF